MGDIDWVQFLTDPMTLASALACVATFATVLTLAAPVLDGDRVIGIITEGLTGSGIAHQIGLGALVDGYAACRTQFLPFCF